MAREGCFLPLKTRKVLGNQGLFLVQNVAEGVGLEPTCLSANGFQEYNQRIPLPLSSVQFVLKQSSKILIPQDFSGLFGTDLNENELIGIDMN